MTLAGRRRVLVGWLSEFYETGLLDFVSKADPKCSVKILSSMDEESVHDLKVELDIEMSYIDLAIYIMQFEETGVSRNWETYTC